MTVSSGSLHKTYFLVFMGWFISTTFSGMVTTICGGLALGCGLLSLSLSLLCPDSVDDIDSVGGCWYRAMISVYNFKGCCGCDE